MIRCWLITVFYYSRWIKAINPKCPYRNLMNYLVVFLLFPSISIMDFILNIFFSSQITCSNTKHYTIITVLVETLVVRDQMQKNFIPCLKVSIYKFSENINRLRSHAKTLRNIYKSAYCCQFQSFGYEYINYLDIYICVCVCAYTMIYRCILECYGPAMMSCFHKCFKAQSSHFLVPIATNLENLEINRVCVLLSAYYVCRLWLS